MDEDPGLCLRVLGELAATRDGAPVELGGRRQRAVLAALVISRGHAVPAEQLADCVWGDRQPANATGALQAYVSHLRRRLQPDTDARQRDGVIASAGPGYLLRLGTEAVDAWRFERAVQSAAGRDPVEVVGMLEEALGLWRGPAYADYRGAPWTDAEVTRLEELRAVASERLLEGRLHLGDAALVVGELEALVAEDPLREERWRLLVLALYRAQRQADALSALRRARQTLVDELGVEPGPALRVLEGEVLAHSPTLDPPPAPAVTMTTPQTGAAPTGGTDLVDREREIAALARAVDDLVAGSSGCVLVEGPPGIGKTSLLAEAVHRSSAAGVPVLSARGSQLERSFGFGSVRQLFETCVDDPDRRGTLLSGAAAAAGGVFDQVAADDRGHETGFAVLHGLYWLTVRLTADGPLVIAVDDVQWCDSASLRYLAYLVKRLDGLPVLVVMTLRTGEQHPDDALLAELALDASTTVLRPQPLSEDATGALVRERLGEGSDLFVGACHRMTSGNPLFLRQLLRALEDEGVPPDVSHVDTVRAVGSRAVSALVMLRLRRMPATVGAAARAVAVLGPVAGLPTVAKLARLPEEQAAAALDTLARGEILQHGQLLTFVHPLVRDAVYDDLPVADRQLHHERAAHILQEQGAAAEEVAAHLLLAPRRGSGETVAALREAARTAAERGASDSSVLLLRRALVEPVPARDRARVLVELGTAETLVDGPAAVDHLSEAYQLLDDEHERARVAMVVARTQVFASPPGVATAFAREAAARVPAHLQDDRQGLVALERVTGFMHGLPPESYRAGPAPVVRGDGDGARMLAATLAYEHLRDGDDRAAAVRLAGFALEGDRLLAVDNGLLWIVAANVLQLADVDLGDFWDRALAHAYATGGLFAALSVNLWRGFTQWRRGELDDALESLLDAAEQQRSWGLSGLGGTYVAAFTMGVELDQGDLDAAERTLESARALSWVGEGGRLLRGVVARALTEQGRIAEALDELATARRSAQIRNPVWAPWRGLTARALAELCRWDEALALVEEEVSLLRVWGAASALGPALRLRGELRLRAGTAEGTADLREALDVLSTSDAALEVARARLALGRCPALSDDEALPLLESALTGARACGARGVVHEAVSALGRRGRPVEAPVDEGVRLSRRQRQILDLAAAGLDADEVAQRLFLSPVTVRALLEAGLDGRLGLPVRGHPPGDPHPGRAGPGSPAQVTRKSPM